MHPFIFFGGGGDRKRKENFTKFQRGILMPAVTLIKKNFFSTYYTLKCEQRNSEVPRLRKIIFFVIVCIFQTFCTFLIK